MILIRIDEKNYWSAWPLTFVLKIAVDLSYVFQILAFKINEKVWRLAWVVGNDEGAVESVVTEKLQFLRVVISW